MKKLITLLVTIAMIGVMLTGCGGSGRPCKTCRRSFQNSKRRHPFFYFRRYPSFHLPGRHFQNWFLCCLRRYRCYCMRSCCHQMQRQLLCFRSKRTFWNTCKKSVRSLLFLQRRWSKEPGQCDHQDFRKLRCSVCYQRHRSSWESAQRSRFLNHTSNVHRKIYHVMYRRAPHSKYARYILKQVYGIYR